MNYKEFFRGKKITVMGLGLLGRGLGDVKFLAECGADLVVTDLKSATELKSSLKQLEKFKNIKYVLGEHRLEDFQNRDMILKIAGVPLNSPYIAEARKNGIPIEMDESLFMKLAPKDITFIGVTGTRGKTTVTTLIYEMLKFWQKNLTKNESKTAKNNKKRQIFLAGNIQGVATLPLLSKVHPGDLIVMELSSWQLQGFGEGKISPHIAIFTNFLDDHLNYYAGKREDYFKDKSYIYLNQKEGDFLIVSREVLKKIQSKYTSEEKSFESISKSKIIISPELPKSYKLSLLGKHNRDNAAYVREVGKILKLKDSVIKEAIQNFRGVSGRQEFIKKIRGIEIYNDTTSTSPDALSVALESLGEKKEKEKNKIVLIMGGSDKGLNMDIALNKIKKYCKVVVLLPGNGTDRVKEDIKKFSNDELKVIEIGLFEKTKKDALNDAVEKAFEYAKKGDRIVFSPGFTSFGMFQNEYDRGDKFNEIIAKMQF